MFSVKKIIISTSAVMLALLGAVGGFFGAMFRMDPGEESAALTHDFIGGILFASACFLGVQALASSVFRVSRARLKVAVIPSVALAVLVPALLFSWQWSVLEGRRRTAQKAMESQTSQPRVHLAGVSRFALRRMECHRRLAPAGDICGRRHGSMALPLPSNTHENEKRPIGIWPGVPGRSL
jgi:hypothetical protein